MILKQYHVKHLNELYGKGNMFKNYRRGKKTNFAIKACFFFKTKKKTKIRVRMLLLYEHIDMFLFL